MWNSKRGGKRLMKKTPFIDESLRRKLSLLLCFSMVLSMLGGVLPFLVPARAVGTDAGEAAPVEESLAAARGETRKEIKARLLRQIQYENWDPYSADMSFDEFYALMELFQEGTLPLDPVAEVIGSNEEPGLDLPGDEVPDGNVPGDDVPDADVPDSDAPGDEAPDGGVPGDDVPDADAPGDDVPDGGVPSDDVPSDDVPGNDAPDGDVPDADARDADVPGDDVPDSGVPSDDVPDADIPGGDAPDADVPGSGAPDADAPGAGIPVTPAPPSRAPSRAPAAPIADPDAGDGEEEKGPYTGPYLPRQLFLFRGVTPRSDENDPNSGMLPGTVIEWDEKEGEPLGAPLKYDNEHGHYDDPFYGPGLEPKLTDLTVKYEYSRPPKEWKGVRAANEGLTAAVIVDGINSNDPNNSLTMSSDADQRLFLKYEEHYVFRVSAQNNDATVLGIIVLSDGTPVYYYTNRTGQSIEVSTTTLPEGDKFIIEYEHNEHHIEYRVVEIEDEDEWRTGKQITEPIIEWLWDNALSQLNAGAKENLNATKGENNDYFTAKDVTDSRKAEIFGADTPSRSTLGAYAFTAAAPDGYTLSFYMVTNKEETTPTGKKWLWDRSELKLQLGTSVEGKGNYTLVNEGWALNTEPVYERGLANVANKMLPHNEKGPQNLISGGTFYNDELKADRYIVAVLRRKPEPKFSTKDLVGTVDNTSDRGSYGAYKIPAIDRTTGERLEVVYDYEDVLNWAIGKDFTGKESIYEYDQDPHLTDQANKNSATRGNLQEGNIWNAGGWNWKNTPDEFKEVTMDKDPNSTGYAYTYQWTFQTNSGDNYILDSLEINRQGIMIPFFSKNVISEGAYKDQKKDEWPAYGENADTVGGIHSWWAETTLSDGAVVKVELLMIFNYNHQADRPQRVYRVTVRNAKNDVTVTCMNLIQFASGAREYSAYQLDGVTGATSETDVTRVAAIQHYTKNGGGWDKKGNIPRGEICVDDPDGGIDYNVGDETRYGANFRFKLADGYGSPYYIYESSRYGVLFGAEANGGSSKDPQTSLKWTVDTSTDEKGTAYFRTQREETGYATRDIQRPVVPLYADGAEPYMRYYDFEKGDFYTQVAGTSLKNNSYFKLEYTPLESPRIIPIPVTKEGHELYWENGDGNWEVFTEWSDIHIIAEEKDGKTVTSLSPALYSAPAPGGKLLEVNEVIPDRPAALDHPAGTTDEQRNVRLFQWDETRLRSQYIYGPDANGWYFIRVTGQQDNGSSERKFALLTIVARPMRYLVRYKPLLLPEVTTEAGSYEARLPINMPEFLHTDSCPTFVQGESAEKREISVQFDDRGGSFYDVEIYPVVKISDTEPKDREDYMKFEGWQLVDENDRPVRTHMIDPETGQWVRDETTNDPIMWDPTFNKDGSFDIRTLLDCAILNGDLGTTEEDVYVFRLVPIWDKLKAPFNYKVALAMVDAYGEVNENLFDGKVGDGQLWSEVWTNFDPGEDTDLTLTVKILTESDPIRTWLAQHPTYSLWNPINNAVDGDAYNPEDDRHSRWKPTNTLDLKEEEMSADEKLQAALYACFKDTLRLSPDGADKEQYENTLASLRSSAGLAGGFDRMGNYTYSVTQSLSTIVLWVIEDKGGLVFHKDVDAEPFIINDEFYFTVDQVLVGTDGNTQPLNGTYEAYPEKVYDENGNERLRVGSDAWWVEFEGGRIQSIVKSGSVVLPGTQPVNYFSVRDGEGIMLYVPAGRYTINELGSRSGGLYRTEMTYLDEDGNIKTPKEEWKVPGGFQWLSGNRIVTATVDFEVGMDNVVKTINFSNQTSSVAFEKWVVGPYGNEAFEFNLTLVLPDGTGAQHGPLYDDAGKYYYFNFNLYDVEYGGGTPAEKPKIPNAAWLDEGSRPDKYNDPAEYASWLEWHNWRPNGELTPMKTGRLVVTSDGENTWKSGKVIIRETYDHSPTGEFDTIEIKDGQRFVVVCTVPDSYRDINYTVTESNSKGYLVSGKDTLGGKAVAAELAYELFVNSKLQGLPAAGVRGGLLLAPVSFLLSGIGLAWLNWDFLKKARRRFAK